MKPAPREQSMLCLYVIIWVLKFPYMVVPLVKGEIILEIKFERDHMSYFALAKKNSSPWL